MYSKWCSGGLYIISGYLMRLSPSDFAGEANRNKDCLCAEAMTGASGRPEDYDLSAETAARVRRGDEAAAFVWKT